MRILVFHGYLLRGTGSNVYTAELAAALAAAGHEVSLVCQDRTPLELAWVDAAGDWDTGTLRVQARGAEPRVTVYRPDIGGLLPVYVADRYAGTDARPFAALSEGEVDAYVAANVAAVREVCTRAQPELALANHLVMGPLVLSRALRDTGIPYAVKVHGSALEYTVKPHPRFLPHAREGLARAQAVLTGSRHTAESLWAVMDDPTLPGRTRLGPPGVDVESFGPREPAAARAGVAAMRDSLCAEPAAGPDTSSFSRDARAAGQALHAIDLERDRLVVFVGKLIGSKGVELLLAAWPRVVTAVPDARLLIVGFGGMRTGLEGLAGHLASGDLEAAAAVVGEDGRPLEHLAPFLAALRDDPTARAAYETAAGAALARVAWLGRLDHPELVELLPAAEAIVVPSTFPEAFGMVAAEGAACGALPVVADHSGLAEVAQALSVRVDPAIRPLLSFPLGAGAVDGLAAALVGWLELPQASRATAREAIVAAVRERYSWAGVARTVEAAARGELDSLSLP